MTTQDTPTVNPGRGRGRPRIGHPLPATAVPDSVRDALKAAADTAGRTLSAEIRARLIASIVPSRTREVGEYGHKPGPSAKPPD